MSICFSGVSIPSKSGKRIPCLPLPVMDRPYRCGFSLSGVSIGSSGVSVSTENENVSNSSIVIGSNLGSRVAALIAFLMISFARLSWLF